MFGRKEMMEMLVSMAKEVGQLKARVEALERSPVEKEQKADPVQERLNKRFAEGLDNLLAYDGTRQEETRDGEN